MSIIDIIGFTGVVCLLGAYFLNAIGKITSNSLSYILLNLFGAALATTSSVMMVYYPFIILEAIWTLVSLYSLINFLKARENLNKV